MKWYIKAYAAYGVCVLIAAFLLLVEVYVATGPAYHYTVTLHTNVAGEYALEAGLIAVSAPAVILDFYLILKPLLTSAEGKREQPPQ